MSSLAELDRSNVVDVDLGSAEFKANAHRHMAEWARRPPFYVLGSGPPQVVVGRYADVHRVFSDTETFASEMPRGPGWEQFNKIMDAQFVTQMDGEQHARVRRLLMPAFSSRRIEQLAGEHHDDRRWHARRDREERPRVRRHAGPRRASRGRCLAHRHGGDGRAEEGDLRRVPRPHSRHHLRQARRVLGAGAPPGVRSHHGRDQGHHRGAARQPALRISSAISSTPATPATSSTSASCSTRFSASAAPRCRQRAAPPAARSICSTPTTTSASS